MREGPCRRTSCRARVRVGILGGLPMRRSNGHDKTFSFHHARETNIRLQLLSLPDAVLIRRGKNPARHGLTQPRRNEGAHPEVPRVVQDHPVTRSGLTTRLSSMEWAPSEVHVLVGRESRTQRSHADRSPQETGKNKQLRQDCFLSQPNRGEEERIRTERRG